LFGLVLVLAAASIPLGVMTNQFTWSDIAGLCVLTIPFAGVGFIIALRQPRNPIGWLLLGVLLAFLGPGDAGQYALLHYQFGDGGLPLSRVAVFLAAGWVMLVVLLPLPIAFFPDGELPSPRWRWALWLYLADGAIFLAIVAWHDVTGVLATPLRLDSSGEVAHLGLGGALGAVLLAVFAVLCVAWVSGQVVRFRRATGTYRQQLKWLLLGGGLCVAGLVFGLEFGGSSSALLAAISNLSWLGVSALPIGIGIGILRYRLYEIDRLISRTISYALITGLLGAVFLGLVFVITDVLPFSSPVGVAAATLAAAALFNPLRRRVQHAVDRRFNRARYDAEAIVGAFTVRLRDAIDLGTIGRELLQAADGAVQPSVVSLWVRPPEARRGISAGARE
jgi:hypothetical protein